MATNPYSMNFGQVPRELVQRLRPMDEVMNAFVRDDPRQQVYMVTGVRGSGKTVFLTEVEKKLQNEKEFIIVDLNPEDDMLADLYSALKAKKSLSGIFETAGISFSLAGISITAQERRIEADVKPALEKMLQALKKHGKKLFIAIDEASNTGHMRIFAGEFQHYLREDFPVYLLMTGLYKNISLLQNEKSLTFLYRAPKIVMEPLNISAVAGNYAANLGLNREKATQAARATAGYSFAFQVLGSLLFSNGGDIEGALPAYRQYLEEYSYEKIWSELSQMDQKICAAVAELTATHLDSVKISAIREKLDISSNMLNQYRTRLLRQGILQVPVYGTVQFALPMFRDFVLSQWDM